jgi:hypothetical protein
MKVPALSLPASAKLSNVTGKHQRQEKIIRQIIGCKNFAVTGNGQFEF